MRFFVGFFLGKILYNLMETEEVVLSQRGSLGLRSKQERLDYRTCLDRQILPFFCSATQTKWRNLIMILNFCLQKLELLQLKNKIKKQLRKLQVENIIRA